MPSIHNTVGITSRKGMQAARAKIPSWPLPWKNGMQHSRYPPPRNTHNPIVPAMARIDVVHQDENHTPIVATAQATHRNENASIGRMIK